RGSSGGVLSRADYLPAEHPARASPQVSLSVAAYTGDSVCAGGAHNGRPAHAKSPRASHHRGRPRPVNWHRDLPALRAASGRIPLGYRCMPSIIDVENVSKMFYVPSVRRDTVREHVLDLFRPRPVGTFVVLDDISFSVNA